MNELKAKVERIAGEYADLIERRLVAALGDEVDECLAMNEILEGIRMLNHMMSVLERVDRLTRGNEPDGVHISEQSPIRSNQ